MHHNRKTILLVEDEAIVALDEMQQLNKAGYDVIHVATGEEAIETVRASHVPIDLILMDIDLGPGMDGTEAADTILKEHDIPIVFLSSHTESEYVEKTDRITSYGYVVKHSGEMVLLRSLTMAFRLYEANRQLRISNEELLRHEQHPTWKMLRENELFLNSVFESVQDGISVLNTDLTIRHVNGVMKRWYVGENVFVGKKCYEVYHGRESACVDCPTLRAFQSGTVEREEVPGHPDSPIDWIELFSYPIKDPESGEISGVVEFVRDISERKRAEDELKRNYQLLQSIIDSSTDYIYLKDRQLRIAVCNKVFARATGNHPEEIIGKTDIECGWSREFVKGDPGKGIRGFEQDDLLVLDGATIHAVDEPGNVGGSVRIFDTVKSPFYNTDGEIVGVLGISRDVTEHRRLAVSAEQTRLQLEKFFHLGQDLMCVFSELYLRELSDSWQQIFGFTREELMARPMTEFVHPEDRDRALEEIRKVLSGHEVSRFVIRIRTRDGRYRTIEWNAASDDNGRVYAAGRDVTETMDAEAALLDSERRFQLAMTTTGAGLWDWDMENDRVVYRAEWKRMLGYEDHEIENSFAGWKGLWHPDDSAEILQAIEDHLAGETEQYEVIHRLRHKTGTWRWILTRGGLLRDSDGRPCRWIGTNIDITEQKRIEQELRHAVSQNRTLLAELQHRVKNNLNVISSLLGMELPRLSDPSSKQVFTDARSRIHTMSAIYEKLHQSDRIGWIELGRYLDDLASSVFDTYRIPSCVVTLRTEMADAETDSRKAVAVGLILNELISNSLKYAYRTGDRGEVLVQLESSNDREVTLRVADDGAGMPDGFGIETVNSTGLKLVQALVRQINGTLELQSGAETVNRIGTVVSVRFAL